MKDSAVTRLTRYIGTCGLRLNNSTNTTHSSVAPLLAEFVLQAGVNYRHVVQPRIHRIIQEFPEVTTTSHLLDAIAKHGAEHILAWKHLEKPRRFREVSRFFYVSGADTVSEIREWMNEPQNVVRLQQVRGIGPKSVDYLKSLLGIPAIAVDRHLVAFTRLAGLKLKSYREVQGVLEQAADQLRIGRTELDRAIWSLMSPDPLVSSSF